MEHIEARLVNLPYSVSGVCSVDENGEPMIYLNARLSQEQNRQTYEHEIRHIEHDDFHNTRPIQEVEAAADDALQDAPAEKENAAPAHPYDEFYRRGLEYYGLERDDPFWDKLFLIWDFRDFKDRYVGVIDDRIDRYTRSQTGKMVKKIFGEDPQRAAALKEIRSWKPKYRERHKRQNKLKEE